MRHYLKVTLLKSKTSAGVRGEVDPLKKITCVNKRFKRRSQKLSSTQTNEGWIDMN